MVLPSAGGVECGACRAYVHFAQLQDERSSVFRRWVSQHWRSQGQKCV